MLDNTSNEPSKFRTKNWVEINDDARGTYNKDSQTKFKTLMLKAGLCDYNDAYILVSQSIISVGAGENVAALAADRYNKQTIFKILCHSLTA